MERGRHSGSDPVIGTPTLVDTAYDRIVGMLLDQHIAPGRPLRTEALASDLGISATPVREALGRLEMTGLVERTAHRGWRAAPLFTRQDHVEVIELRLLLEPENARKGCARADDEVRAELSRLAALQASAPAGPGYESYRAYLQADWSFHLFDDKVITDASECSNEHTAVADAFDRRSPEDAEAAMRDHLTRLRDRVATCGRRRRRRERRRVVRLRGLLASTIADHFFSGADPAATAWCRCC